MPGVIKKHSRLEAGHAFPASRYNDPRGNRPSALERSILRYRAVEVTLYLFYAEEVRDFMLTQVHGVAINDPLAPLMDAEDRKKVAIEDAAAVRLMFAGERHQGKKLKVAFTHAIKIGIFTEAEADELNGLLDYRNDIAHRIHLVMSDVNRSYVASDYVSFTPPKYKDDAIDRLRAYRRSLWERARERLVSFTLSIDGLIFEFAQHVYENELKRLERLIKKQIGRERHRIKVINAELDLHGTELVGDLAPRFPANHRPGRTYGDDYVPPTGHLTKRGIEICYRLFDLGKSPMAVAYLMGMTVRSAERRRSGWLKSGALRRTRAQVDRYDPVTLRKLLQR